MPCKNVRQARDQTQAAANAEHGGRERILLLIATNTVKMSFEGRNVNGSVGVPEPGLQERLLFGIRFQLANTIVELKKGG